MRPSPWNGHGCVNIWQIVSVSYQNVAMHINIYITDLDINIQIRQQIFGCVN